ncbi:hypothetical protein A3B35_02000 [Candidatus Kaiserbacteria bacterium RIFCSPLOWO2_01_FULL_54_24]|uniref:Uncharacterized protein n=1 Tax=Candidatus Kaiserbacteria bacterium RIFCSPLOWO2_01_FULL_54_24 TaxID=1798515 RepID=A0A1F6ET76_9BACT|nr:MAG: hypothetical protein A3B35_02000 [Candidatus Kaiserbacteria bacterium RIFCSPLOWO2_01_FULL_54_24]
MSKKKAIKAGSVKVTLLADDRAIAEQYAPPSESIRAFVERQSRRVSILKVAMCVMFRFYLPQLTLTYPLTRDELIRVAEEEDKRIRAEERRSSRAFALPG